MPLLIAGIAALVVGLILLVVWGWHLLAIIKAIIPLAFLGAGVVLTYLGYEEYRESSQAAKNAAKFFKADGDDSTIKDGSQPVSSQHSIIEVSPDGKASPPSGPTLENPSSDDQRNGKEQQDEEKKKPE